MLAVLAPIVAVVVFVVGVGVGVVLDVGDVGGGVKGGSDAGNIVIGIDVPMFFVAEEMLRPRGWCCCRGCWCW